MDKTKSYSEQRAQVREHKIMAFVERTGAKAHVAALYLDAEEWSLSDALISYRADQLSA